MKNQTPPPFAPERTTTATDGYFVKLFGEVLGPFTEEEIRQGLEGSDFPSDATVSLGGAGDWYPIQEYAKLNQPNLRMVPPVFEAPVAPPPFEARKAPPPFKAPVAPPPFKKPKRDAA